MSEEPPLKKQRVSIAGGGGEVGPIENVLQHITAEGIEPVSDDDGIELPTSDQATVSSSDKNDDDESSKEARAGITAYVQEAGQGFTGVLKQRYTDFLVNEILPDGTTLHLKSTAVPLRKQPGFAPNEAENEPVDYLEDGSAQNEENVENDATATQQGKEEGQESFELGEGDRITLRMIFGEDVLQSIEALHHKVLKAPKKKPKEFTPVQSKKIEDRQVRTQAHQAIRKVFGSRLESWTEGEGIISIRPAPGAKQARGAGHVVAPRLRGRPEWAELGGEYLHFTLFKENKDTMEIVYFLASQLKMNVKSFHFGGTKDRRAVTAQRCSAYRTRAEQLHAIGKRLRQAKVGDFAYQNAGIELGELGGNEFCITLRDCHFPGEEGHGIVKRLELAHSVVTKRMESFQKRGFINYYGLQRFGSFSTSTSTVGTKLLQNDLKGAIDGILQFSDAALAAAKENEKQANGLNKEQNNDLTHIDAKAISGASMQSEARPNISSDDRARALAIDTFTSTGDSTKALSILPRKFSAESNIIRHLGSRKQDRSNDYQGALMTIPRTLRLMYVHAYQSLVWNTVAAERWRRYGDKVIEGDLVLISELSDEGGITVSKASMSCKTDSCSKQPTLDDQGDPIVAPAPTDRAAVADDYERARPLTASEAASGKFSIFDVVLPLPGYDVVYPPNDIDAVYKDFMASEKGGGLDPYEMRRKWKDVSLSGGYRKLLVRAEAPATDAEGVNASSSANKITDGIQWELRQYTEDEEQLVETDLDSLNRREGLSAHKASAPNGRRSKKTAKGNVPEFVLEGSESDGDAHGRNKDNDSNGIGNSTDAATTAEGDGSMLEPKQEKIALILRLRLGPSMYATMALRELMGKGGVKTFKPDFGGGR